MRDTRFDSRSSEWIGDMTVWLRDHAEDNSDQLERLRRNLRRAREQEDEAERYALRRRIAELTPLLQETRELAALTARYYDRSYHRHERYTI